MLEEHFAYVSDSRRLALYRAAIAETVKPGDVVADLGCGTGVLGLLCLQAGASRVFAVDATSVIDVARASFDRAGLADRVTFIKGLSQQVALPEQVDVVICDHVGYLGFDYRLPELLQDARQRFLRRGGALIPRLLRLKLATVSSDACRARVEEWASENVPTAFHWLRQNQANARHPVRLHAEDLLSEAAELGSIDLRDDRSEFHAWSVSLHARRDGRLDGLAGWFECELAQDVWMTNSPTSAEAINRPQAFLPIDPPIVLEAGEPVNATVMARPEDGLTAWTVHLPRSGRKFSHSTWHATAFVPDSLARVSPSRIPRLERRTAARLKVLAYCDGARTVQMIEDAVLHEHPDLFPSSGEIRRFVAEVLAKDASA
jgi:ubiquinone/menaquinone biosynthesis C-methylase UbiE